MNNNHIDPEQLAEFLALLASPMSLHRHRKIDDDADDDDRDMAETPNDDPDSLQEALHDGVIVTAKDPEDPSCSYEAVYLFGQFFPRTRESVRFWANASLSDIDTVHEFTDIAQLNEFFWNDTAIETNEIWQRHILYEDMTKEDLIALVKHLHSELVKADRG